MKKFLAITMLMAMLSGCASAEPAAPSPSVTQTQPSAEPEEVAELTAEEIITASHDLFFSQGMTERVASGGDNYILTYAPSDEFVAALYNETFDDVISVSERGMFTVLLAYDLMVAGEASITKDGSLIIVESVEMGSFEVEVQDGLIVAGRDLSDSWSGNFEYAPDEKTLALLQNSN